MKFVRITAILSTALLFFSCVKENEEAGAGKVFGIDGGKIVRLADNVRDDALLLKFSSVPTEAEILAIEEEKGVSLEKLFPSFPGNEELEAAFGLDRWYQAILPEGQNIDRMAMELSSVRKLAVVEYEGIAEKNASAPLYTSSAPGTKAGSGTFNDPMLANQWHYKNYGSLSFSANAVAGADINVLDVWANLCTGDPSIIVAVVDEGVKYTHPDLQDNMWVNSGEIPGNGIDDDGNGYIDDVYGFNFVTNGPISWDVTETITDSNNRKQVVGDSGHGTHCAGTIAAVNNNGKGVCGVAGGSGNKDGCRIMSCQVFSGTSGGAAASMARAIKYAADMGASVISASLGYSSSFSSDNSYINRVGSAEIDAIHYFEAKKGNNDVLNGNIAIFAAGNEAHNYAHYPGAFVDIISVSAFGPDFLPAYYTNYGPGCNIAAPGGEAYHLKTNSGRSMVLSTLPSELSNTQESGSSEKGKDYGYMQGTSMACPHVSGVVALGLSYAHQLGKKFDRDEFKRMILSSVNDIDQRISSISTKSYAYYHADLAMAPYFHQMGTGAIDAWRLMMKIEGTPSSTTIVGKSQWVDLSSVFGTASVSLTYLKVDIPQSTIDALGLQKIAPSNTDKYPALPLGESYGYIQFGRLYIYPTKVGSGKISITAVGGGDHLGGGDNPPGGMELTEDISIIAREGGGGNGTGGWL